MEATREMPKYKSHKEVWALKIKSIVRDGEGENRESDGSAIITPEEEGYAPLELKGIICINTNHKQVDIM